MSRAIRANLCSALAFAGAASLPVAAAVSPIDRWATAVGGRDRIAAIHAVYREATIEVAGFQGSIKAWHTADGRYRKEAQVATRSSVETFDAVNGAVRQGAEAPRRLAGVELERSKTSAFANANAMFYVFFPQRHRGTLTIDDEGWIVFKPEGGIDWRV